MRPVSKNCLAFNYEGRGDSGLFGSDSAGSLDKKLRAALASIS